MTKPTTNEVCQLSNITSHSTNDYGGKAHNLAILEQIRDVQTKSGFAIAAECFTRIVTPNISDELEVLEKLTLGKDTQLIKDTLSTIRTKIAEIELAEIELPECKADTAYAVRSSATCEDGNDASFSGKYESYLFVKPNEIKTFIKAVWSSLFTFNNLYYLDANNIKLESIGMGVVIQEMLAAQAAGTVFVMDDKIEIDGVPPASLSS